MTSDLKSLSGMMCIHRKLRITTKQAQKADGIFDRICRASKSAAWHYRQLPAAREAAARVLETDASVTTRGVIARGGRSSPKLSIEELRKAGLAECVGPSGLDEANEFRQHPMMHDYEIACYDTTRITSGARPCLASSPSTP